MITIKTSGSFKKTKSLLKRGQNLELTDVLNRYGRKGVSALKAATPKDSGQTADAWDFEIEKTKGGCRIIWTNSNVHDGAVIAVLLQYGHATRNGGWVEGHDYINPAVRPIFEDIAESAWKEVTAR